LTRADLCGPSFILKNPRLSSKTLDYPRKPSIILENPRKITFTLEKLKETESLNFKMPFFEDFEVKYFLFEVNFGLLDPPRRPSKPSRNWSMSTSNSRGKILKPREVLSTLTLENLEDPRIPSFTLEKNLDLEKKVPVLNPS